MSSSSIYLNPNAKSWSCPPSDHSAVLAFHRSLPFYNETPLVSFPDLAKELGIGHVLVKDESNRFGMPAFKILGASWSVFKVACQIVGLPDTSTLDEVAEAVTKKESPIWIVTCTAGNWGRAVARMGKLLNLHVRIHVSYVMPETTQDLLRGEGAEVHVHDMTIDECNLLAEKESKQANGPVLILDSSWEGFEQIPGYCVEGYSSMFGETDKQVHEMIGKPATCVIASVGVGTLAQAVTLHYKQQRDSQPTAAVVAVEPVNAACLKTSLEAGTPTPVKLGFTIMAGMNAGVVSFLPWPVLKAGVDASVTVTDWECHEAIQRLHQGRVDGGPCGAAPLVALQKLCQEDVLKLGPESVVVLFCSERSRPYDIPQKS
ncbi:tryptophan synthase beta subunit-like PLP-dependent enzyme [Flagelloscypha sp. PMI_526]|nr:tryptophan synthase beta subunit-like PLP-dependent enzyme [Flagelloscypha sp. PMI_526]